MKKVAVVILILVFIVGVTAYLNVDNLKAKDTMQEKELIVIKSGEESATLDKESINGLGEVEFSANLKSDGKLAEKHTYTGVLLKKVLDANNIDLSNKEVLIVKGIDGYTVAIGVDEVMEENNVYIAYGMDGKPLGKKEDGGRGPYEVIIRKDPFSQRWCKFLSEIEVQ